MSALKFSVLIANYNNGVFFSDCWQSLLKQSFTEWEAIIVDDCSTDDSLATINKIVNGDARARIYINKKNLGCGYTKKRCAELATGSLMGFLDPDDALEINALEVMIDTFSQNPSMVLAYSKHLRYDEKFTLLEKQRTVKVVNTRDPFYFNIGAAVSHFCVFKASAYRLTTGIDEYMLRGVDQDLYLKMFEQGETLFVDHFLYKYRVHGKGISTGADDSNAEKADYWHWYAINSAAKRRGVYVEKLYTDTHISRSVYNILYKNYQVIINSGSYKLAQKISQLKTLFRTKK